MVVKETDLKARSVGKACTDQLATIHVYARTAERRQGFDGSKFHMSISRRKMSLPSDYQQLAGYLRVRIRFRAEQQLGAESQPSRRVKSDISTLISTATPLHNSS